jgi:hypothetical protein
MIEAQRDALIDQHENFDGDPAREHGCRTSSSCRADESVLAAGGL